MRLILPLLALLAPPAAAQQPRAGGDIFLTLRAGPRAELSLSLEGVDLHRRDAEMATPLHRAAAFTGDAGLIRAMIARGAAVDARDARGRTALHHGAAAGAPPPVLAALLAAGADPDARDAAGLTPLRLAAGPGAAALLTLAGASPCSTGADGRPALGAEMLEAIRREAPAAYPAARAAWLGCL